MTDLRELPFQGIRDGGTITGKVQKVDTIDGYEMMRIRCAEFTTPWFLLADGKIMNLSYPEPTT